MVWSTSDSECHLYKPDLHYCTSVRYAESISSTASLFRPWPTVMKKTTQKQRAKNRKKRQRTTGVNKTVFCLLWLEPLLFSHGCLLFTVYQQPLFLWSCSGRRPENVAVRAHSHCIYLHCSCFRASAEIKLRKHGLTHANMIIAYTNTHTQTVKQSVSSGCFSLLQ